MAFNLVQEPLLAIEIGHLAQNLKMYRNSPRPVGYRAIPIRKRQSAFGARESIQGDRSSNSLAKMYKPDRKRSSDFHLRKETGKPVFRPSLELTKHG